MPTTTTGRYHERFTNLHTRAVAAVDDVAPAVWNTDRDGALAMLRELAEELAETYDMPVPTVDYGPRNQYRPTTGELAVTKPSIVSFLHEFRHHMQHHGRQANSDIEEDARGWSISLFATAEPEYFETAWRNGTIWFMPPHPEAEAAAGATQGEVDNALAAESADAVDVPITQPDGRGEESQ